MSRDKGRPSPKIIERDFPHVVEVAVPLGGLGKRLDAMMAFHAERGIRPQQGRGRRQDDWDIIRWHFADAATVAAFRAQFAAFEP